MLRRYFLVGLIVIIVFFVSLIPFFDGFFFKSNYHDLVDSINKTPRSPITMKVMDYHLGWFSSKATLAVTNTTLPEPLSHLVVKQTITHGPFIYDTTHKKWRRGLAFIQSESSVSGAAIQMQTVAALDDSYENSLRVGIVTLRTSTGLSLIWSGLKGNFNFNLENNQLQEFSGDFTILPIKSLSGETMINVDGMSMRVALHRHPISGMMLGKDQIKISNVNATQLGTTLFSLKNLNLISSSDVNKVNLSNRNMKIEFDSLAVPEISFTKSSVDIDLQQLNLQAVADAMNAIDANKLNPDVDMLVHAITPNTKLGEKININSSLGNLKANGNVYWGPEVSTMKTAVEVMKSANMKVDIRISGGLLQKFVQWYFPTTMNPVTPAVPTEASLLNKIDELSSKNQIQIDTALQMKDLVKRHLPALVFTQNLDRFVKTKDITEAIATELSQIYGIVYPDAKTAKTPVVQAPILSANDRYQIQLANWLRLGYLVKEGGDDYITTIEYKQGQLYLGGILLSPQGIL